MGRLATGLICVLVTSCDCGGGGSLTRLQARLVVYDSAVEGHPEIRSVDFGAAPYGSTSRRAVGIRNEGDDELAIESALVVPEEAPFTSDLDWTVPPGGEREFTVAFHPQAEGEVAAKLELSHNGYNGPTTSIDLEGSGVEPRVVISTDMLDFGQVTVDQREELEVVLTNETPFAQPFRVVPPVQSAAIFGANPRDGEIPPNATFTVRAWFQPVEEGEAMNTFGINWCDTCEKQISVRGEGIKPVFLLDPPSLDFGTSEQGDQVTRLFVVQNIGNVPLEVKSIAPDRNTTAEFTVRLAPLPVSLQPGEELAVSVDYSGSGSGDDGGNIEVATDAWDDPNTPISETIGLVALSATTRGPDINAFPTAVSFGTVAVGAARTRILSLQNVGNAPLAVASIALESPTAEITMEAPPALPTALDPGLSIDLRLHYTAADEGMDGASVVVASNDGDEPSLTVPITGIGGTPGACWIEVAPTPVTFGLVERGRTASLPIELRNSGTPCSVSNVRLNGAPEFAIASGGAGMISIAPGGVHRIEVEYTPADYGIHNTLLEFDSNDPSQLMAQIPISGASDQTSIIVIPSELDFGIVPVGCSSSNRAVTVYNTGASPVQINNGFLDPATTPEIELTPFGTQNIAAGASAIVDLRYRPASVGADSGVLFIVHSAGVSPVVVPLTGEGQSTATVIDRFSQAATARADVLFVIDNSGSMDEEQAFLGTNLGAFLSFAQMAGIDYQIGITTTDVEPGGEQGRFVGTLLTPSTPDVSMVFNAIVTGLGTDGSGDEMGLEASYLALSDPLINTWNAGFLRADAALAVIYVSDEIDQSPNLPAFYESFLRNIKGVANTSLFSASAIVGTTDPECTGPSGEAEYAPNYISVANNTGGIVEEICAADWGQSLTNIGLNSFGLRRQFGLSSEPDPSTIAVDVDGSPAAGNDWAYDPGSNSVVFDAGSEPDEGASIEISYDVACLP